MMTRFLINMVIAAAVILPLISWNDQPHILSVGLYEEAEQFAYDLRMRASINRQEPELDERIVIVDIDQPSIDKHGNWPWRRDRIAELVSELLDTHRASLVVLADNFPTPDDLTSDIFNDLNQAFGDDAAVQTALRRIAPEYNYDDSLARVVDGQPVVFGYEFEDTERQVGKLPSLTDFSSDDGDQIPIAEMRILTKSWPQYGGFVGNAERFNSRVLDSGFTNFAIDNDGSVRGYNMLAQYFGAHYLSLAAVAMRYADNHRTPLTPGLEIHDASFPFSDSITGLSIADHNTHISRSGSMLLNYTSQGGPEGGAFSYIPAHELIGERVRKNSQIDGRVVLIGSTAVIVNDIWRTPANPRMPGVEVHATALQNLLDETYLHRPQSAWLYEALMLIFLGVLMSLFYPKLPVVVTGVIGVVGVVLVYYLNYHVYWLGDNEFYRIVPFVLLFVVMTVTDILLSFLSEYRQKKKVEGVLNQYIPPELAQEVHASKKGFSMEGEIREMSILFSDVRGFTSISEKFQPQDLTKFMNEMLTVLSHEIHVNRGTIDKYIGDAVMAFWNAPLDDANHAINSVRGALGMQRAMQLLSENLVKKGYPELKMGIGINTGEACVGNMGSEIRLSYTVMGDTVNLASRLEGITKQYGVDIIVGEKTYEMSEDLFLYRPVDSVRVKGKEQAVMIYHPIAEMSKTRQELRDVQQLTWKCWEAYRERRFDEMLILTEKALQQWPNDGLMAVYKARAETLLQAPPPEDWEPITRYDTK